VGTTETPTGIGGSEGNEKKVGKNKNPKNRRGLSRGATEANVASQGGARTVSSLSKTMSRRRRRTAYYG